LKIAVFIGTRPEIIKMQPIVKEIEQRSHIELLYVHTGQHYDWNMSGGFIKELVLPEPKIFLNVKSSKPGAQIAKIIATGEKTLLKHRPDLVMVQGDTNSACGSALIASRMDIPVCHVEAGCRSFDKKMPEEKNRTLIADCASIHFAPTKSTRDNLLNEGISNNDIFVTGHPIVDVIEEFKDRINKDFLATLNLKSKEYYLLTLHREENVTDQKNFTILLKAIQELSRNKIIVFPIHPRTRKQLTKFKLWKYLDKVITVDPFGYFETLSMIKHAQIVLTDSGGIQQETALLQTPCITLRKTTEWAETVDAGINFLATNSNKVKQAIDFIENDERELQHSFNAAKKIFGQPCVAKNMLDIIEQRIPT
jgi:UDP-N-acetylglucosamine 2-epimerase (non-hydrolysing)